MSSAFPPLYGARFQFDRQEVGPHAAHYAVRIFFGQAAHDFSVRIALPEGTVEIQPAQPENLVPGWALVHVRALGRELFREAQKEKGWPRRIMRWKNHDPQAPGPENFHGVG